MALLEYLSLLHPAFAVVAFLPLIIWLNIKTDVAKIKGLLEIRGIPLFGSLFELGDTHAKKFSQWSQGYGAVFQVRLGNRVGTSDLGIKVDPV